jgi:hypothetical protein
MIGTDMKLGDLPIYVVGKGTVGIIAFPEVFGIESGRLKQVSVSYSPTFCLSVILDASHYDNLVNMSIEL